MEKPPAGTESVAVGLAAYPSTTGSPGMFPRKVLIALTAAVLLAHLLLLQAPMTVDLNGDQIEPTPVRAFNTRSVEPEPAESTATQRPVTPAVAVGAPPKRKSAPRARAKTVPSEAEAVPVSSAAANPPSAALAAPDQPGPEPADPGSPAQEQGQQASEAEQLAAASRPPREQAPAVTSYALPGSVRLNYKVEANKFPFSLNSELLWQQSGENYELRVEFSAFGRARVQTSRGQITPQGLAPIRFSDKYRSEVAAHFDHAQGKVTFSANSPDAPLLAGAQDRLSILVQLASMIAGDPGRYQPATTIAIQTIGPRNADTWLFTVGEQETLTLPGGEQLTLKLVRNPRQEFDQKVELWLAPALGYLPARLRITEHNGDYIDQQWLATAPPI